MKVLVLGNGFDIDHDLPTSYDDFIKFCKAIIYGDIEILTDNQKKYLDELNDNEELNSLFHELLDDNNLLQYFFYRIDKMGPNWIDLEREIKFIVDEFRNAEELLKESLQTFREIDINDKIFELIEKLNLDVELYISEITLNEIHNKLCKSLNDFACALELYIFHFINNTDINCVAPDIAKYHADKVLVFNYSSTYERIYGGVHWKEDIDYVHGKAKECKDTADIILGITSQQRNQEKVLSEDSYVEFEKYFQRITKRTGSDYRKWLSVTAATSEQIEIAFFGHSLDATDSDIIKDFLNLENVKIAIYYHDDSAHQQIVANLVEILGKKRLIQFVSGNKPKISLVQQQNHLYGVTEGIEIEKDINSLYRLYKISDDKIFKLIKKIQNRIQMKDSSYFHSQRKVISLWEALQWNDIDGFQLTDFEEICKGFPYEKTIWGAVYKFDHDEWYDYTPLGEESCADSTKELIDIVNEYNKEVYFNELQQVPYMYLDDIFDYHIFEKNLLDILSENSPTEEYWNQLANVIYRCSDNKHFETFFNDCNYTQLALPIRAKYKRLKYIYEKYLFDISEVESYTLT